MRDEEGLSTITGDCRPGVVGSSSDTEVGNTSEFTWGCDLIFSSVFPSQLSLRLTEEFLGLELIGSDKKSCQFTLEGGFLGKKILVLFQDFCLDLGLMQAKLVYF